MTYGQIFQTRSQTGAKLINSNVVICWENISSASLGDRPVNDHIRQRPTLAVPGARLSEDRLQCLLPTQIYIGA